MLLHLLLWYSIPYFLSHVVPYCTHGGKRSSWWSAWAVAGESGVFESRQHGEINYLLAGQNERQECTSHNSSNMAYIRNPNLKSSEWG
jgi:hypothetical protein